MALFTIAELETYLQRPVNADTAALALTLATEAIRGTVGPTVFDAQNPAPPGVKWLALELGKRVVVNDRPRSMTRGEVTDAYGGDPVRPVLTADEVDVVRLAYSKPDEPGSGGDVYLVSIAR